MHKLTGSDDDLAAKPLIEVPRLLRGEWAAARLRLAGVESPSGEQIFDYIVDAYKEGEYS